MTETPQDNVITLPDGRIATVTHIDDNMVEVDIPEPGIDPGRSVFALVLLGTGTMVLSIGVGGLFNIFAGLAVAGFVMLCTGFLLAVT